MENIIKQIEQADDLQIDEIIHAVIQRYNILRPDREGAFLSLPAKPKARDEELDEIFSFIRSCYNRQK